MRVVAIIPARHASTRFPGKPLVEVLGVPMIVRVARQTAQALGRDSVIVATDDPRIERVVTEAGFRVQLTSSRALTGTDRVAEAASAIDADIYVNVQGDEPMLDPSTITAVIARKRETPCVVNAMAKLTAAEDVSSVNIPKVIATSSGRLIYMSRAPLPAYKDVARAPVAYWKQVCVYAFDRAQLAAFADLGHKSAVEESEDIEILRFLELGIPIQMVEVTAGTLAIDVPEDVPRVEAAMRERGLA